MARYSLSKISEFVQGNCAARFWIGMDVHKKTIHVALLRDDGQSKTFVSSADSESLAKTITGWNIPIESVVYEAGPTGFGLARALMNENIKVVVAAPSRIPRSASRTAKTDRLDCLKLAKLAKGGMVKSIAIPSPEQEAVRGLSRRRDQISQDIRRTKQRIKSLLLYHEIKEPPGLANWSKKSLKALESLRLNEGTRYQLDSLLMNLEHLQISREAVDQQLSHLLEENHNHSKAMKSMQSVPGVGFVTACKFRTEIFNPQRFKKAKEVTALVGLAPVVRQSGGSKPTGKLIPVGKNALRSVLVQAAWSWIQKDAGAKQIYNNIRLNTGLAQKAIVAVARKLCIILWRLCVELRSYRPQKTA
jgi:transposase